MVIIKRREWEGQRCLQKQEAQGGRRKSMVALGLLCSAWLPQVCVPVATHGESCLRPQSRLSSTMPGLPALFQCYPVEVLSATGGCDLQQCMAWE